MIINRTHRVRIPWLPPASQQILLPQYRLLPTQRWNPIQKMPDLTTAHTLSSLLRSSQNPIIVLASHP